MRTAHNPLSPALLDACDRLGLLVLEEPFDTWKVGKSKFDYGQDFDEWWQRDISAMVLRDRNHPSIAIWGIGNEIPEAYTDRGGILARQLAAQVRSIDNSRPITQAFPGSTSGPAHEAVFQALDLVGYNYNLADNLAEDHSRAPSRIILTTESYPGDAFEQWRLAKDNSFVIGEFIWTAMDYLGESGIGAWGLGTPAQAAQAEQKTKIASTLKVLADRHFIGMVKGPEASPATVTTGVDRAVMSVLGFLFGAYPWHASNCGDLDLTGRRKPQSYYRDILWNGGDRVYATVRFPEPEGKKIVAVGWAVYPSLASWTWPGEEGKELQVEVYSGVEKVRLFLNGKLVAEQRTGGEQQHRAVFTVRYEPGTLRAVGVKGDRVVAESVLTTAARAARLRLNADRTTVKADGQDLTFVTVEALDLEGRFQPNADHEVEFAIDGPAAIVAVGNADGKDTDSYQGTRRKLYQGQELVVIRPLRQAGPIRLTATARGLSDAVTTLQSKASPAQLELP